MASSISGATGGAPSPAGATLGDDGGDGHGTRTVQW
eukprot:CAMPEP_0198229334 /NCGR_PEP_ID=MMETSP1445-20131203/114069_1 /TAXON_ID=36898 /ORGANISM="Pyramimonas sp., Strain CCMP2087" /LENGTH=35 /DNA_ID= /DNA_START= /DNA_END= /DNA_ORIENTATION=